MRRPVRCHGGISKSRLRRSSDGGPLLPLLLLLLADACAAGLQDPLAVADDRDAIAKSVVRKCCGPDDIVVVNRCRSVNDTDVDPWTPEFTAASPEDAAAAEQKTLPPSSVSYKLQIGFPNCKNRQRWLVYHYRGSGDRLVLYPSGKLRHYVLKNHHDSEEQQQRDFIVDHERSFDYEQDFYCLDKVIDIDRPDLDAQIAVICTPPVPSQWANTDYVMRRVVNPACQAIAILCLLLVAIVHFVLPQLRDLVGNMVTTLAGCMIIAKIANIVCIFVEYNSPISYLTADTFLYTSILGSFIWLNSMGYYIWRTFKSRNVFLRITDGRKYCYYSLYVWGFTLTMGGMALFAHLILDTRNNNINKNNYSSHPSSDTSLEGAIGWLGISVIFVPIMCTILVNMFFLFSTKSVIKRITTYGQIHHKMKYSFDMFSKLFAIMFIDLVLFMLSLTHHDTLFYVYIVFNPVQAALVLYVTVIRPRRVKFLLRKACCYEKCILPCCRPKETDVQAGTEWGEEMMAFNTADY